MIKRLALLLASISLSLGCSDAPKMISTSKVSPKGADAGKYDGSPSTEPVKAPVKDDDKTSPVDEPMDSPSSKPVEPVKEPVKDTDMGSTKPEVPETGKPMTGDPAMGGGACASLDLAKVRKPEDFACLGSVDAILKNNPAWLKKHFTLFHSSQSAQGATMENPRIIVSAPDGSFIFTTATLPNAKKEIEIAVYDYQNETWQFAGLEFADGKVTVEKETCKACHGGENPRTNWGSYGQWTGAYGQGGNHGLSNEQVTMVNKFKNKEPGTPEVMKYLDFSIVNGARWAGPGEVETNEGIGYMMAFKAGRSLASKIIKKGTKAQVRDVILETICANSNSSKTANDLDLPFSVHLQTTPDSGNSSRFRAVNVGYQSNVWYFGLVLMAKAVEADPALAAAAPQAVAFAKKNGMALMLTNGISEYLAKKPNGGGIYQSNRNETQNSSPFNSDGAICSSIRNYRPVEASMSR